MNYKKQILYIIFLSISLLWTNNNIEFNSDGHLSINSIENEKISLMFKLPDDLNNNNYIIKNEFDYPIFNYVLSIPANTVIDLEYLSQSNKFLDFFNNQKNNFTLGIKENEKTTLKEEHVYISKELIVDSRKYIVLTIDPVKLINNEFRAYNNFEIHINVANSINDLKILTVDQFSSILTRETINHTAPVLLIIAPNDNNIFNLMTPLINWKKMKGYKVLYHTLDDTVFTTTEIKNYIQNLYSNYSYYILLLVLIFDMRNIKYNI